MNAAGPEGLGDHERIIVAEALYRRLSSIMASEGICVIEDSQLVRQDGMDAVGESDDGIVYVEKSLDSVHNFRTLVHEYAHELLHWKEDTIDLPFAVKETQAEVISFTVAHHFRLETDTEVLKQTLLEYGPDETILGDSTQIIIATSGQIINKLQIHPST